MVSTLPTLRRPKLIVTCSFGSRMPLGMLSETMEEPAGMMALLSLSTMVRTALLGLSRVARLVGVGLKSRKLTVSLPSITRSSMMGTVKVRVVTKGGNESTPVAGM